MLGWCFFFVKGVTVYTYVFFVAQRALLYLPVWYYTLGQTANATHISPFGEPCYEELRKEKQHTHEWWYLDCSSNLNSIILTEVELMIKKHFHIYVAFLKWIVTKLYIGYCKLDNYDTIYLTASSTLFHKNFPPSIFIHETSQSSTCINNTSQSFTFIHKTSPLSTHI